MESPLVCTVGAEGDGEAALRSCAQVTLLPRLSRGLWRVYLAVLWNHLWQCSGDRFPFLSPFHGTPPGLKPPRFWFLLPLGVSDQLSACS